MGQEKTSHPGVAAVLSFVFNGLGQLYNGEIFKGLLIIFLSTLSMLVLIIASVLIGSWLLGKVASIRVLVCGIILFLTSIIAICVLGIYSIINAYRVAARK